MWGKGKLSLGQSLFGSVKSTQIIHVPFFFLTMTTLASQYGYCTSLMNLASSNLLTSSLIIWFRSTPIFLLFCRTGLWFGSTLSLWQMTSRLIPGMLVCDQGKQSLLSTRTSTSLEHTSGSSHDPILMTRSGCSGSMGISSSSSTLGSSWLAVNPFPDLFATCNCYKLHDLSLRMLW